MGCQFNYHSSTTNMTTVTQCEQCSLIDAPCPCPVPRLCQWLQTVASRLSPSAARVCSWPTNRSGIMHAMQHHYYSTPRPSCFYHYCRFQLRGFSPLDLLFLSTTPLPVLWATVDVFFTPLVPSSCVTASPRVVPTWVSCEISSYSKTQPDSQPLLKPWSFPWSS